MNQIKKTILMAFFFLFSLCSCGNSVPVGAPIDIADKIATSDIRIEEIKNDKEENPSSSSTRSFLKFRFQATNNSENLCDGELDFDFDIRNSLGAVVYSTKTDSTYGRYDIDVDSDYFYPGESTKVTAVAVLSQSYSFTKLENYTIHDLKATKAAAYEKTTIYSTESEEEKTKIKISNIQIREVDLGQAEQKTGERFYRVDFQTDFSIGTTKQNQYLSFASVLLTVGSREYHISMENVALAQNSCAYFFSEALESTEGAAISMKACLSKPQNSGFSSGMIVFLIIMIALLVLLPPIIIGVIVAVVISKPKKAGK